MMKAAVNVDVQVKSAKQRKKVYTLEDRAFNSIVVGLVGM